MPDRHYDLPVHSESLRKTASHWLLLGLVALVGAGFFSLLLVLARTPAVHSALPLLDLFQIALVVHVNLSVLIWLLSMAGMLWSLACKADAPARDRLSFWLAATGTAVIIISPFAGAARPLMNNYVPVLQHPVFYCGLGLFTCGIFLHLLRCGHDWLRHHQRRSTSLRGDSALRLGSGLSAAITGIAVLAFITSWAQLPRPFDGPALFEYLFWGGGHVLQFTHTLLMMLAWVLLLDAGGARMPTSPRYTALLFSLIALPVVAVPFIYLQFDVLSTDHRLAFTQLMKYGGLFSIPLGLAVLTGLWRAPRSQTDHRWLRSTLWSSLCLFTTGGVLGFMIAGLDIVIPAHYHGSTVGVTIALMGVCYLLLPRLGYGPVPPRLAFWQPVIYASGQLMHIIGLAWSGGYGVQRKTAALEGGMQAWNELAGMGLMGLGGLVSVLGGLLFLLVCWRSVRFRLPAAIEQGST